MTISQAVQWGWQELSPISPSAKLDAEILLTLVLRKDRTFLIAHGEEPLGFLRGLAYKFLIARRKKGVPVAYLTGKKEFYGLEFKVSRQTLIPRPDTETLVDEAIGYIRKMEGRPILLDIGTGTACIPVAILSQLPEMTAVATDVSPLALMVAAQNLKRHGMEGRVKLLVANLLKGVPTRLFGKNEIVVTANLPYIPKDFSVDPSTKFEPRSALYGGGDGLEFYKGLAPQLEKLKPKALFFELFDFQAATLALHLPHYRLIDKKEMTGQARVVIFERVD